MRSRLLRLRIRRRVIVTLKTGEAFTGVLYDADADVLVLREAEALGEDRRSNVVVDGEVLILRPDVSYVQLP